MFSKRVVQTNRHEHGFRERSSPSQHWRGLNSHDGLSKTNVCEKITGLQMLARADRAQISVS